MTEKDLAVILAKRFEADLIEVLDREVNEPDFLMQEDFPTAESRASEIMRLAGARSKDILALAIAVHREKAHGENTKDEQDFLKAEMPEEDIEIGTRGWWRS